MAAAERVIQEKERSNKRGPPSRVSQF